MADEIARAVAVSLLTDYIKNTVGRVWKWLWGKENNDKWSFLVIGAGATGKSTFGKLLSSQYAAVMQSAKAPYEESLDIETYKLADDPTVEFTVGPGQARRRDIITWPQLGNSIGAGHFRGIVLVTAYGYHSLEFSYKNSELYKGRKDRFLTAYVKKRREEEIKVLQELVPYVRACQRPLWFLTIVNKQDLWWPERDRVEAYYNTGEYGAEIKNLQASTVKGRIHHELAFASFHIANLKTGSGELLFENAKGYDHSMQLWSLEKLYHTLESLMKWENEQ